MGTVQADNTKKMVKAWGAGETMEVMTRWPGVNSFLLGDGELKKLPLRGIVWLHYLRSICDGDSSSPNLKISFSYFSHV